MPKSPVQAPVTLLAVADLTATARVLWLALRAYGPAGPARLAAASGLTPATVRRSLAQLESRGWYSPSKGAVEARSGKVKVPIPAGLLAERRVRPRAKLFYGSLQTLPGFVKATGEFTYASLSLGTGISTVTLKQLVRELAESGWIGISQTNQLRPVHLLCATRSRTGVPPSWRRQSSGCARPAFGARRS